MIAIIDYSTGNLCSVTNALDRLGAQYIVTANHQVIQSADRVILPGVGQAAKAMAELRTRGLDLLIPTLTQPVMGICIGMQLMCKYSQEGDVECIGIFENSVNRFSEDMGLKIPQMGWNTIHDLQGELFNGINSGSYIYYVHSYAATINSQTVAKTKYGQEFSAALAKNNFYGTQFHPEKSGETGSIILQNFLNIK